METLSFNMANTMRTLICLTMLLLATPSADAAVVYDVFYRANGIDAVGDTTIEVDPGSTIGGVEVILRERTDGEENVLRTQGLRGFAIQLGSSTPDSFRNGARNPAFQLSGAGNDGDTFSAFNFTGGTPGVEAGLNTAELVLGTVDLLGPSSNGQSTQFTLSDFDLNNPNFEIGAEAIDNSINFGNTLTLSSITAIPEPSAFLALAGIGTVVSLRRRRRR